MMLVVAWPLTAMNASADSEPWIQVLYPNGGEIWHMGETYDITWTSGYCGSIVRVALFKDDSLRRWIESSTENDGLCTWTVDEDLEPDDGYQVAVLCTDPVWTEDRSDGYFTIALPGVVTVTLPNGGEQWQQGRPYTITWSSLGNVGSEVMIELLKGTLVDLVVTSATPNDGSYSWQVPLGYELGTDYRIRVSSTSQPYSDVSDGYFSIVIPYSWITVLSPNGGEVWEANATYDITWTSGGDPISSVSLDLYDGEGNENIGWDDDGVFSWTIPADFEPRSDYYLRIGSNTDPYVRDFSDGTFTIVSPIPRLNLMSPNGGETWIMGTTYEITWNSSNDPSGFVKIELCKEYQTVVITPSTANDGSYEWLVPVDILASSDYRVKITTSSTFLSDYSDSYFTIALPGSITVTSPNGGELWEQGKTYTITWTSVGDVGSDVEILLLGDALLEEYVVTSSTPNDGAYSWLVPLDYEPAWDYAMRVSSTINPPYISDTSDNWFAIVAPLPQFTVVSPNGGENWEIGSTHYITWTSAGNPGSNVKIDLYKGPALKTTIVSSTENDGSYSWTIPKTLKAGDDYRIRITSTTMPDVADISDSYFTLYRTPGGGGGGGGPPDTLKSAYPRTMPGPVDSLRFELSVTKATLS
jgi:5-hydroxyisourate hydrolase-like protein (transthyretin family)